MANILRTLGSRSTGHSSTFNRFFSKSKWNEWVLSKMLAELVFSRVVPNGPIFLAIDDTVEEHPGRKVWGKGRHRDAVRSSHSYTAYRWGHKWVVVSVVVRFPFSKRSWALPILISLYRSPEWSKENQSTHRTPAEIAQVLLTKLISWFPRRQFIIVCDSGFGTSAMARFCDAHKKHLRLVSKFYRDAVLHELPPKKSGVGRPRTKGKRLLSPEAVVAETTNKKKLKVSWYGGREREVYVVTGVGFWYRSGKDLVEVRWLYVQDATGTHRDEYFFTTDTALTPEQIISFYTGRWAIETTFQEAREYLKLETTKAYCKQSVIRAAPCLFGLYSIVILIYLELPDRYRTKTHIEWVGKQHIAFSVIITSVRRAIWAEWIFETPEHDGAFRNLPKSMQNTLLYALAPAA